MTEEQLFDEAERRMAAQTSFSTVSRNSALRIARDIGEADFLDSTPDQWLAAYRKVRPDSSVDVGRDRIAAIKALMYTMKTIRKEEREAAKAKAEEHDRLEREQAELKAKAEAEHKAEIEREARENPVFTTEQIVYLADYLTRSTFVAVDLKKAQEFIHAFKSKKDKE